MTDSNLLPAIERNRRRLWLLCYRMLGEREEADDVCQEAIARALERAHQRRGEDPTGWLLRIAARCCLDHLRRRTVRRRVTQLVDPLVDFDSSSTEHGPEQRSILREDVRFAVIVALQQLTPRQRVALVLADICDRPLADVAVVLETNANAVKALLHRARGALAQARGGVECDSPVDDALVRAFARALEQGAIDELAQFMAEDVWGVVDGGGVVRVASVPTRGRSVVARRFANFKRKLGPDLHVLPDVRTLNGEPAIIVRLAHTPTLVVATIYLSTRAGSIVTVLVDRDPKRLTTFGTPVYGAQA